jgi:hypothetical protein
MRRRVRFTETEMMRTFRFVSDDFGTLECDALCFEELMEYTGDLHICSLPGIFFGTTHVKQINASDVRVQNQE